MVYNKIAIGYSTLFIITKLIGWFISFMPENSFWWNISDLSKILLGITFIGGFFYLKKFEDIRKLLTEIDFDLNCHDYRASYRTYAENLKILRSMNEYMLDEYQVLWKKSMIKVIQSRLRKN